MYILHTHTHTHTHTHGYVNVTYKTIARKENPRN